MKFFKMAVAVDHQHHEFMSTIVNPSRCRFQSYPHLSNSILDFDETNISRPLKQQQQQKTINELNNIGVHRSFSTPCLSVLAYNQEEDLNINHEGIEVIGGHQDSKSRALITKVILALKSGTVDPIPASSGLSGAYLLPVQDNGTSTTVAVIKPTEEPIASGSPKGFSGRMLGQPGKRPSIRIGETGPRELAAYLLDHGGFSGVPPTALFKISSDAIFPTTPPHSKYKMMSVQCFVDHESDAADLGPSCFSVASIHKIGVLDIRLLNLDRHAGNMLVKEKELVPIDHGLCLPERLDDPYFEWLHWPQALVPFSESEIAYIMDLDPMKDAELIRNEVPSIRESSIRVLVVCTVFLKQAVIAGLSLADIGEMMTREYRHSGEDEISLSLVESLCMRAKATSMICMEESAVSFGEVSEEEWLLFLNVFEKLLPQFFEGRKKKGNCCWNL